MKKMIVMCLMALMTVGLCTAQTDKKEVTKRVTTTIFKADIECDHCVKKIMENISSLGKGVKDVKVDVAAKTVTVSYDPAKNSDQTIIKGLASLKVKAEVVKTFCCPCGKECDKKSCEGCPCKSCDKSSCAACKEKACDSCKVKACGDSPRKACKGKGSCKK